MLFNINDDSGAVKIHTQRVTIISRECTYIFFAIPYLTAMGLRKGFQSMVEKKCIFCIYFCRNTNSSRISYLTNNMCTLSKSHRICRYCTYFFYKHNGFQMLFLDIASAATCRHKPWRCPKF